MTTTTTPTSVPTLYSYGTVSLLPTQYLKFPGLTLKQILTDNWTMSFRVRLRSHGSGGTLISMDSDTLYLRFGDSPKYGTPNNRIKAVFKKSTVVDSLVELEVGTWYQITMTVAKLSKGAGVTFYVNGSPFGVPEQGGTAPAATTVSSYSKSSSGDHPYLGSGVDAEFGNISFWSRVLTETEIIQANYQVPPSTNLVASYDFSTPTRTVDTKKYTVGHGAAFTCVDTGLYFGGALALPDPADGVAPGSAPFTVSSWVCPSAPPTPPSTNELLCILGNGDADSNGLAFGLKYASAAGTATFGVRMPGTSVPVMDATVLPMGTWHNLTATWDGHVLTFYVDGVVTSTHPGLTAPGQVTGPVACIGGMYASTSSAGYSSFFRGRLQGVGVWSRALTATEVATFEAPSAGLPAGALAYFDLATSEFVNAVTQRRLRFEGASVVAPGSTSTFSEPPSRATAPPNVEGAADEVNLAVLQTEIAEDEVADSGAALVSTRLSAAEVAELERQAEFYLSLVPELQKPAMRALMRRNLRVGLRRLDLMSGPPPGAVTSEIQGAERVFYLHKREGRVEVMRRDAAAMTDCQAAKVNLLVAVVSTFLCVLGVGFSGRALTNALAATFEETAIIGMKLAQVGAEVKTAAGVLTVIQALIGAGSFGDMLRKCLSGVRWYELAFTVLGLMANILGMFATGGWYIAFIAAQVFLNIGLVVFAYDASVNACKT